MPIRTAPAHAFGDGGHLGLMQTCRTREPRELGRFEPEPKVRLIAHRLVVVGCIVDDHDRSSHATKIGQLPHDRSRTRSVMKKANRENRVRPLARSLHDVGFVEFPKNERYVVISTQLDAFARAGDLLRRAVDRHDALEHGRQNVQEPTVSCTRIDRKRGE